MNLPNKLTVLRIIMIPFILMFMMPLTFLGEQNTWNIFIEKYGMIFAVIMFLLASLTDTMDGQIARKRNLVTNMGKFLDPIADKLLVASVLIAFVQRVEDSKITAIMAIIIISREFIVTGIRLLAADKNVVIAASNLGKVKTVVQVIAIIYVMIIMQISISFPTFEYLSYIQISAQVLMWIAVFLTIFSGFDYVKKNFGFIKE